MRKSWKKRIAGCVFAAVMVITTVFIKPPVLGEFTQVKAASGHWEMTNHVSLGPRNGYKTIIGDNVTVENNGFNTSDDSWSCHVERSYYHSDNDVTYTTDMDLKIDAPAKIIEAGKKFGVGYEYTIRDGGANFIPSLYAKFTSDERAMTADETGTPSDAGTNFSTFCFNDGEVTSNGFGGHDYYNADVSNPNFWEKSTIYSTLDAGQESGEKVYLKLGANFGQSEIAMRAVYEYTWKTDSSNP